MNIDEEFNNETATSEEAHEESVELNEPEVAPGSDSGSVLGETFSPFVVGIDLGTCNSAIAVVQRNEPVVIKVNGEKSCPSVMTILDGEAVVGKRAKGRALIDPDNVVASAKRHIGSTDWKKVFPGMPDREYRAKDIAAEILAKLISAAQMSNEVELGGTPKKVVICVPANFNDRQKQETREAARTIGLEVLHLLDEPTAAAICYAANRDRDQTILVYDLGGGTLDVSVLKVESRANGRSHHSVLAKAGIPKLGGDDFDHKIMELMAARFDEQCNVNILDLQADAGVSKKTIRESQQRLRDACEKAKQELTTATTARVEVPNLLRDETGTVHNLDEEITREEFNELIRPLVAQSRTAVEEALSDAKLEIEDISRIILVGGSTRVPIVKTMLSEMFGKEPHSDVDPDTVVAMGAAIYGAWLIVPASDDEAEGPSLVIDDIVTHNLGIEVRQGGFNTIIAKNTPITGGEVSFTKEYKCPQDNMTELAIRVYQSNEDAKYTSEESVVFVDELFLKGIPPKPKGEEKIRVTFTIDSQNMLRVKAESSSAASELTVQRNS